MESEMIWKQGECLHLPPVSQKQEMETGLGSYITAWAITLEFPG